MRSTTPERQRPPIDGGSPPIQRLREEIASAAKTDWPVLVCGERGTGKELVAYELHVSSDRAGQPYRIVNIGSISTSTRASELFGHVRGAFTGAERDKNGWFRAADGGTLFLDEIGNCDLDLQASLLRVLEYGEIQPVGAEQALKVNVRVIAATNAPVEEMAAEGKFRLDLIDRFRLKLTVPPIRCRGDDVPVLASQFLQENARKVRQTADTRFAADAEAMLRQYSWPGNVRELENCVAKAVLYASFEGKTLIIQKADLRIDLGPAPIPSAGIGSSTDAQQQTLVDLILDALMNGENPVLDDFQRFQELRCPGTLYFVRQIELALEQFLQTDAGQQLLSRFSNGAILHQRFNLSAKKDSRKKSFSRFLRDRLEAILERYRKDQSQWRGAVRRHGVS